MTTTFKEIQRAHARAKQLKAARKGKPVRQIHHAWVSLVDTLMDDYLGWPADQWVPSHESEPDTLKFRNDEEHSNGVVAKVTLLINGDEVIMPVGVGPGKAQSMWQLWLFNKLIGEASIESTDGLSELMEMAAQRIHSHLSQG